MTDIKLNAAGYQAILQSICQYRSLSGNTAVYLAILQSIWQYCSLSGNTAVYLAIQQSIYHFCRPFKKGWPSLTVNSRLVLVSVEIDLEEDEVKLSTSVPVDGSVETILDLRELL